MPADHNLQKFHCFTMMQRMSLFPTLICCGREMMVIAANACGLSCGLCEAYLIFLLKHFKHFYTFPSTDT